MRSGLLAAAAAAAAFVGLTAAQAATLSTATGDVLVNTGSGFVRGTAGQNLNAGDRVMIGRGGGSATVSYDPSCFEQVAIGGVVTVRGGVPCNTPGAQTQPAPFGNVPTTAIVIGAAAAVGGGILIYNATKSSSP